MDNRLSLSPSKVEKAREAIDFLSSLSLPGPSRSESGSVRVSTSSLPGPSTSSLPGPSPRKRPSLS